MPARLVSVNVGLRRDISWRGKTVHTGIWKNPTLDRVIVRRLNIDGDGQGNLGGHGGVNRAVMVCQTDSYRYWERELAATIYLTDNLVKTLPSMAWPTPKFALAIAFESVPPCSKFPSRVSPVTS